MKEQIIELVNLYTAVELAEMIRAKDRENEYQQEEIDKLKISLKYYRESTNQAAELINQATEKKHGKIREAKFCKPKIVEWTFKIHKEVLENNPGIDMKKCIDQNVFIKNGVDYIEMCDKSADDMVDVMKYQLETAVSMNWKSYRNLKEMATKWESIKWAIDNKIHFVGIGIEQIFNSDIEHLEQLYKESEHQ